jgi:integrase
MACAAVRCSACAGRISICMPGRSPSTRPGSWSSTGPHRRAQVPQRQADAPAQRRTSRRTDRAAQTPAGGERDRWHGLRVWGGRAGLVGEYVTTDAAGPPVHPEWYSDEFGRLLRQAGLRRITLHDSRHATLTLMEHAAYRSRSSASGRVITTRRSPRRPTSMPATRTCNEARPLSPRFKRLRSACEKL